MTSKELLEKHHDLKLIIRPASRLEIFPYSLAHLGPLLVDKPNNRTTKIILSTQSKLLIEQRHGFK